MPRAAPVPWGSGGCGAGDGGVLGDLDGAARPERGHGRRGRLPPLQDRGRGAEQRARRHRLLPAGKPGPPGRAACGGGSEQEGLRGAAGNAEGAAGRPVPQRHPAQHHPLRLPDGHEEPHLQPGAHPAGGLLPGRPQRGHQGPGAEHPQGFCHPVPVHCPSPGFLPQDPGSGHLLPGHGGAGGGAAAAQSAARAPQHRAAAAPRGAEPAGLPAVGQLRHPAAGPQAAHRAVPQGRAPARHPQLPGPARIPEPHEQLAAGEAALRDAAAGGGAARGLREAPPPEQEPQERQLLPLRGPFRRELPPGRTPPGHVRPPRGESAAPGVQTHHEPVVVQAGCGDRRRRPGQARRGQRRLAPRLALWRIHFLGDAHGLCARRRK